MPVKPKPTAEEIKRLMLDEDDFGHEMRVGSIFRLVNSLHDKPLLDFTRIEPPEHGGTYIDSHTKKPRQFDYRCRIVSENDRDVDCAWLAVECKNLDKSAPLVICGRPRTTDEAFYYYLESILDRKAIQDLSLVKMVLPSQQFYPMGGFVGKSLNRVMRKNNKWETDSTMDIYDKWSQALCSAIDLAEYSFTCAESEGKRRVRSMVIPIVVVPNETLWVANFDDSGLIPGDPVPVDECDFFVGQPYLLERMYMGKHEFRFSHVHFVTIRGFQNLLSSFWSNRNRWTWIFSDATSV